MGMGKDFYPPQCGEVYDHVLFIDVKADVNGFIETRNGDGIVWFDRLNVITGFRDRSFWSLARFAKWFGWAA
jgi:hypothetical protein